MRDGNWLVEALWFLKLTAWREFPGHHTGRKLKVEPQWSVWIKVVVLTILRGKKKHWRSVEHSSTVLISVHQRKLPRTRGRIVWKGTERNRQHLTQGWEWGLLKSWKPGKPHSSWNIGYNIKKGLDSAVV